MNALILSGLIFISSLIKPITTNTFWEHKILETNKTPAETRPIVNQESEDKTTQSAAQPPTPFNLPIEGVFVADANTSEPIITYNHTQTWPIASLTKLMSAIVYLDQKPNLNKVVALQKEDMVGGAAIRMPVGTKFRAYDLLHASLMSSANNATNALVRGTDLSREQFVEKMNQKAKDFGLTQTQFVEPTGLSPENKSTPEEIGKIINHAFNYPEIASILSKTHYHIRPINAHGFDIGNTNKLLKINPGFKVLGGKTGFTYGSRYNYAAKVKKEDKNLIVVVFGDKSFDNAFKSAQTLATAAFSKNGA